jgi:RimJ/RimL family protein N-acetyltransferase
MADFPLRDEGAFYAHWHKIMADPANLLRTILWKGEIVGNMVSFIMEGKREVGYWLGREYWGKGIASAALEQFLREVTERPLYGVTAKSNPASGRVLEKCGFVLDHESDKERVYRLV